MKSFVMNSLRKWLLKPKRTDQSLLARFYYADEELNAVASELDSFDGRKDTARCNTLVMKLRNHQDAVLTVVEQIMREVIPDSRARRDYRIKFPEEVLQESLAGQLWFGAECLAAGSSIVNKEIESMTMRPLAKSFTKQLDELRSLLREQCFRNIYEYTPQIQEALVSFDQLFTDFELSYVSAMVPVKSMRDYDALQDVTVLFCETASRAMASGLLNQEQFDSYDPLLMFAIPRLAIVCGLLVYPEGPLNPDQDPCKVSEMFRQQLTLLFKIRELLMTLDPSELISLERLICNPDGGHALSGRHLENNLSLPQDGGESEESNDEEEEEEARWRAQEVALGSTTSQEEVESSNTVSTEDQIVTDDSSTSDSRTASQTSGNTLPRSSNHVRSVTWRGSSEFNFCLPRNTSQGAGKFAEPVPRGLQDFREGNWGIGTDAKQEGPDCLTCKERYGVNQGEGSSRGRSQHRHRKPRDHLRRRQESTPAAPTHGCTAWHGARNGPFEPVGGEEEVQPRSPREGQNERKEGLPHHQKSGSSSSCDSSYCLELEQDSITRIIQMAKESAGVEARSKFKDGSDLVHQLFVCISKVADQLQTNFASDFRHILKATFECQSSNSCIIPDDVVAEGREGAFRPLRVGGRGREESEVDQTALDALEELVNTNPTACQEPFLAPVWLPDESSQNCMSCKVHFTFMRRRHHCRNCGKIFCSQCSSNYVPLPHIGHNRPVRACNACYIFHIIPFTNIF